jgi:hypothetical protein
LINKQTEINQQTTTSMKFTTLLCALVSSLVLAAPVMKATADHSNASISLPTVVQNLEKRSIASWKLKRKANLAARAKRASEQEACNLKGKRYKSKYRDVANVGRFNVGRCSTIEMTESHKAKFKKALAVKMACLAKGAEWIGPISKRGRCSK